MIGASGVQRAAHWTCHDVFALRLILAPDILKDADVAIGAEYLVGQRQYGEDVRAVVAREAFGRIVGRAREYDGRVAHSFGNDDYGIELDAIAQGNHDLALYILVGRGGN